MVSYRRMSWEAKRFYESCCRIGRYEPISIDKDRLRDFGDRLVAKLNNSPIPYKDCPGHRLVSNSDAWKVLVEVGKKKGYDLEKIAEDLQRVYDMNVFRFKATEFYKFFLDVWERANEYADRGVRGDHGLRLLKA